MTRILVHQMNPTFGDFKKNVQSILKGIEIAKENHCSLMITPELALTGYPPNDLLLSPSFFKAHENALKKVLEKTQDLTLILGALNPNKAFGKPLFNSAVHIENKKIVGAYHKCLLPTYDVFDENRYFAPGKSAYVFAHQEKQIALSICEDIWFDQLSTLYPQDPLKFLEGRPLDLMLNLSASPFELNKFSDRLSCAKKASKKLNCPLLYCNQSGANDDLIFDGKSFLVNQDQILQKAPAFKVTSQVFDLDKKSSVTENEDPLEELFLALSLGIKDYFHKLGFKKGVLGLSGGIDSAVVACLATHALGAQNVSTLLLPSRFSSPSSEKDARALCETLKIQGTVVPIESIHEATLKTLDPLFQNQAQDLTEENIQSRIRGLLLMAFSNKFNHLVLSCSNKSELAIGYATLYGDMIGALAPIADLTKSQVYRLARYIQKNHFKIPEAILTKEPSAELREGQKDSDTLPPYEFLDQILEHYVEKGLDAHQIARELNRPFEEVQKLLRALHRAEYKRRQGPLVLKTTSKAFSSGWKFPIVHRWEA